MKDVTGAKVLQIVIRQDGSVVWINTEDGCIFRVCRVEKIEIVDERTQSEED